MYVPSPLLPPPNKKNMKPSKVYTGTIPIQEHIDHLVELYGYPQQAITAPKPVPTPPKQSLEIQRLKRESGLV